MGICASTGDVKAEPRHEPSAEQRSEPRADKVTRRKTVQEDLNLDSVKVRSLVSEDRPWLHRPRTDVHLSSPTSPRFR